MMVYKFVKEEVGVLVKLVIGLIKGEKGEIIGMICDDMGKCDVLFVLLMLKVVI